MEEQNSKITPEKAAEILRKEGKEVSIEEAEKILDFLKNLAKIVVKYYLKPNENS
jgi:hypothetical protein